MIIVYKSNTGYTEQYAKLLGKALEMPSYELSNVPECHKGAEVIYLGWLFAGTIVGYKKCARKYKVRCVAGVGMSPPTPELAEGLRATMKIPSAVPVFYLQGGFDITKLKGPMKLIMKVKCREIAGRLTAKPELNAAEQATYEMTQHGASCASTETPGETLAWYRKKNPRERVPRGIFCSERYNAAPAGRHREGGCEGLYAVLREPSRISEREAARVCSMGFQVTSRAQMPATVQGMNVNMNRGKVSVNAIFFQVGA